MISYQFTKEYATRGAIVVLIIAIYMIAFRPARSYMSHNLVKPIAEKLIQNQENSLRLEAHSKSVNFKVFIIDGNDENTDKEITFGFPWGFYLFFPLVLLILLDRSNRFYSYHLVIQFVLGILMLLFFMMGLYASTIFLHLYKLTVSYLIPGAAFLLLLFVLIKDKKLISQNTGRNLS